LKAYCALDEATLELLKMAMRELKLSARAYDRILKVVRIIADLAGSGMILAVGPPRCLLRDSSGPFYSTWNSERMPGPKAILCIGVVMHSFSTIWTIMPQDDAQRHEVE